MKILLLLSVALYQALPDSSMQQHCENPQHEALEEEYFLGVKMASGWVRAGAYGAAPLEVADTTLCEKAYQSHVVWVRMVRMEESTKASFISTCEAIVPARIQECSSFSVAKEHSSTCLEAFVSWEKEKPADASAYRKLFFAVSAIPDFISTSLKRAFTWP